MRHEIISISKAKAKLLALARNVHENGQAYLLTKDGEPVSVLVPIGDYEALLETADVLANPETVHSLERALEDERAGRLWQRNRAGKWVKTKKRKTTSSK